MTQLPIITNENFHYDLLLIKDDSYNVDAKAFVDFLKNNNMPITLENLIAYSIYLNQTHNGIRYSANTYNKRLQGAKERIKFIFYKSIYATDKIACYQFEEALKKVKTKKINSVSIEQDKLLTNEEIQRLINESSDKLVSIAIEFLYATGLRISEMLNILINDIKQDSNKSTIRILGKRQKERKIYASNQLINKVKNNFQGQTFLFEHNGKQYNRIALTQRITMQGKIILNKNISAHTLRHSFASNMLKKTNNLKGVSKYLGHSSTSTTANLYIHDELIFEELF